MNHGISVYFTGQSQRYVLQIACSSIEAPRAQQAEVAPEETQSQPTQPVANQSEEADATPVASRRGWEARGGREPGGAAASPAAHTRQRRGPGARGRRLVRPACGGRSG